MKTVIVYVSTHHGNTKKLIDEIVKADPSVALIDAAAQRKADLTGYDRVGIASGVAFGKYYPQLLAFLKEALPGGKQVFFIHTAGKPMEGYNAAAKAICRERNCRVLGTYHCKGYDTFGPFGLIGGIAKGHPDEREIKGAAAFYLALPEQ